MGTQGVVHPFVFLLMILVPSLPPCSVQFSAAGLIKNCSNITCPPNATCVNDTICTCLDGFQPHWRYSFPNLTETCEDNGTPRPIPDSSRARVPAINCSAEFEQLKKRHGNSCVQGERSGDNSSFCSFFNSAFTTLRSACGDGNAAVPLTEKVHSLNSILNSSFLLTNGTNRVVLESMMYLLKGMEVVVLAAALQSPEITQKVETNSTAVETRLVTEDNCRQHGEPLRLSAHGDIMAVDCSDVFRNNKTGAVAFIAYSTLRPIFNERHPNMGNSSAEGHSRLISMVVSGAVGNGSPVNLSKPANFTLNHEPKKEEEKAVCAYWKSEGQEGEWSPEGCSTLPVNDTHTTCSCNHLSSFAILAAPGDVLESYPLTIITYVGLALSLLCLLLAILTFLLCRSIWSVSTSIHLQLCLCLFLGNLLFLSGVKKTEWEVACKVIAGLLHFLFLACFTWMSLEGLHLFLTVRNLKVVNYTSASRFKKRYMYPFGYGFPALIVAISAAIKPDGYGTSQHCWLSLKSGFRWSFLGPVCAIILINMIFFALTLWILRDRLSTLNTDVSTLRNHRLLTFKAIAQVFILGCTWSLGLLQFGPAAKVMAYLFTIINLLQGPFIFLVHCLLNRQVREEYRRWFSRIQTSSMKSESYDISMSTVHTSSSKAAWQTPKLEASGTS
ncbi:adhesion G protein-coupled receptor E3-like [Carettochelys insculpta]|uniref:adhesion G protein-coupled receptor E3-like n=1 Tax=Carettochelys insculpta TaxID=44489 RepID=UPI003EB7101D